MASGSSTQDNSSAGGASSGTSGPFSWNGTSTPTTFDPKDLGTQLFADTKTAYEQGPKINPVNPFTDYSAQTKGLISGGIDAVSPVANGEWLSGGNPYFEEMLRKTRDNTTTDVNSTFNSNGRFGADIHAQGLATGLADSENAARASNFETEWQRMLGAQGQGLGLSGLLDSKAAEKTAADATMWDRTNNAPFNHLAQYLGLLRGGDSANETNKPVSIWDILGGIGSTVGSFL